MNRSLKAILIVAGILVVSVILLLTNNSGMVNRAEPKASLKLGKTETRSSMSSGSTSSKGDGAMFASDEVLLIIGDPHPLTERVANLVTKTLTNSGQVKRVAVMKPGQMAEGSRRPDLFIWLGQNSLDWEGTLTRTAKVNFGGSFGTELWQSSYYSHSDSSPPLVQFTWQGTADLQSTFTGVHTDPYGDLASDISKLFSQAISNQLARLSEEHSPLPGLPDIFYGPYEPVADFPSLKQLNARRICSYHGLLTSNQTFWTFTTATNPVPDLERIVTAMESSGWKTEHKGLSKGQGFVVRMNQPDAEFSLFANPASRNGFSAQPENPTNFIAHYRKPFSAEQRHAALETLFEENVEPETLLGFQHAFSSAQRNKLFSLIEQGTNTSAKASIWLAEHYVARQDTNAAVRLLLRANALSAAQDDSGIGDSIRSLLKKVSPNKSVNLKITPDLCRELGFVELDGKPATIELSKPPGSTLTLFRPHADGLQLFSVLVKPARNGSYPWQILQWKDGSRSRTSSSFDALDGKLNQTFTTPNDSLKVQGQPSPDRKQIHYIVNYELKS